MTDRLSCHPGTTYRSISRTVRIQKVLFAVLVAAGVLSACSTDTGATYTARKLNIAGQDEAYRVTCSGLFESQKSCMSKAVQMCKDKQVVAVQALDNPQARPVGSDARQFDFACAAASRD